MQTFNQSHVAILSGPIRDVTVSVDTLVGLMRRHADPRTTDHAKIATAIKSYLCDVKLSTRSLDALPRADVQKIVQWCEAIAYNADTRDLECAHNVLAHNTHTALTTLVLR